MELTTEKTLEEKVDYIQTANSSIYCFIAVSSEIKPDISSTILMGNRNVGYMEPVTVKKIDGRDVLHCSNPDLRFSSRSRLWESTKEVDGVRFYLFDIDKTYKRVQDYNTRVTREAKQAKKSQLTFLINKFDPEKDASIIDELMEAIDRYLKS